MDLKKIPALYLFLAKAALLFLIWLLIDTFLNDALTLYIHTPITELVVNQATWVLETIGMNARSAGHYILIDNVRAILVDHTCNGLVILLLFIGFIAITNRGNIKQKLVFILLGSIVVHIVNVIRVSTLAYHYIQSPETFDFNHKYTYTVLVYSVVGLLWWIWTKEDEKE